MEISKDMLIGQLIQVECIALADRHPKESLWKRPVWYTV